jgi:hypothetical protein
MPPPLKTRAATSVKLPSDPDHTMPPPPESLTEVSVEPPTESTNSMRPPAKPLSSTAPPQADAVVDSTVFDNNHIRAPAALETMIGKPFRELDRRAWLRVRDSFSDIQKLLLDAFMLRRADNRACNGPDRAKLGKNEDRNLKSQWRMFVMTAARQDLLPFEPDSAAAMRMIEATKVPEYETSAEKIARRYDDVRMPMQMRVFAEQVLGYPLQHEIGKEQWADLLKYEDWEWAGYGFEWKVIFATKK